ncbi:MAG TPA: RNA polymerase-binding protein DksA [Gammaproteobacteria bacterium]|nr:RNA polymerase-binding protein DksA [Gammaproteobacteria bacterium]
MNSQQHDDPLPPAYVPDEDEDYMNPRQLAWFRQRLIAWREELVEESRRTVDELRDEDRDVTDEAERASRESEHTLALRTRERYRKLIPKINAALDRIDDGSYGYCDETGEPIGVKRLLARPIAILSVEAQERHEKLSRQLAED